MTVVAEQAFDSPGKMSCDVCDSPEKVQDLYIAPAFSLYIAFVFSLPIGSAEPM